MKCFVWALALGFAFPATAKHTCVVEVDVMDPTVHSGEATRSSDEIARADAWANACAALQRSTRLDCEDRERVEARRTSHQRSLQIQNGQKTESVTYAFGLRAFSRRTASATGPDRAAACRAAIERACGAADRRCPPAQAVVRSIDGVAAKNLAIRGDADPRGKAKTTLHVFERGGRFGYRDNRDTVVIAPRFVTALGFSEHGIAGVVDDEGWAIIDLNGRVLLRPFVYDNGPDYFSDGLARFVDGGRIGFYDRQGRVVIPARFHHVRPFSEGRAAVCSGCSVESDGEHSRWVGGRWGFIDKSGETVIATRYESARRFEAGTAQVELSGAVVEIDLQGTTR